MNLDIIITKFISLIIPHNIFFDYLFYFFSAVGNSFLVWILILIIAIVVEEKKFPGLSKKDLTFVFVFTLTFILATATSFLGKNQVKRTRPCNKIPGATWQSEKLLEKCPTDYSFPSGHATISFAAATTISFFDKKRKYFYYLIAILISVSRVYLGVHYFFDVIAGALLGWIISKVTLTFLRRKILHGRL